MKGDRDYQKLLNKILQVENLGDVVYKSLASKVKDKGLRLTYERLALNERRTAGYIANEILALDKNRSVSANAVVLNLAKLICDILTARQLAWLLKAILQRRMYSKWYNIYRDKNRDFWLLLLNHENLQHELLSPFWEN